MTLLKTELEEQLDLAGVPYPKSATKKRLVELLEMHAPRQIDALVERDSVFKLTDTGAAAGLWLAERADATTQMWAAWLSTNS
ncbi:MAG TPA: hypothetical protein GX718_11560, partial [Brevibacterium sp.]|nr:hypothetical protein [Brevibacterium sp.]